MLLEHRICCDVSEIQSGIYKCGNKISDLKFVYKVSSQLTNNSSFLCRLLLSKDYYLMFH